MLYALLDEEKVPEVLKNKPKWVSYVAMVIAVLGLVLLSISIGIIIGYTYCYIEHRTGLRAGNLTETSNFQIVQTLPKQEYGRFNANRTINGAIMSSLLVSRILTIGHALIDEQLTRLPWANEDLNPR